MPAARAFFTTSTSAVGFAGSRTMPLTLALIMFSMAVTWVAESPGTFASAFITFQPLAVAAASVAFSSVPKKGLDRLSSTMPMVTSFDVAPEVLLEADDAPPQAERSAVDAMRVVTPKSAERWVPRRSSLMPPGWAGCRHVAFGDRLVSMLRRGSVDCQQEVRHFRSVTD